MKVFIVYGWTAYEADDLFGVYTTKIKAKNKIKKLEKLNFPDVSCDGFNIYEFELDGKIEITPAINNVKESKLL